MHIITNIVHYNSINGNLNEKLPIALNNLDWKHKVSNSIYIIDFPINWLTWGSTMKISLANSKQCNIEVKTKLFMQIIDWGDSAAKINKLVRELQKLEKNN